ncbi:NlpC/P60 family protein [Streptomyces sp. NPDC056773]|uniref:C40 family peptidase n=1 Tax=unclassified Streptomyces TaxID=2593676 RepID=UPI00369B079B
MKKTLRIALVLLALLVVTGVGMMTTFGGATSASAQQMGPGGGIAADAPVPGWIRALIDKFAGKCPQTTPSLVAAQIYTESGFDPKAVSPVGAQGLTQFMPGTWAAYGIDGDGDGKADPFNPADSVASQVHYDCVLAKDVKDVPGDATENMLAAYNAGPGAVLKYQGIPPYSETRGYVKAIRELAAKWASSVGPDVPAGEGAATAIAAAKTALGTWYLWGGPCTFPYQGAGGCDCSSLMKMAWGKAGVNIPRVTYDQVRAGTAVPSVSQLQPGDLLFTIPGPAGPEHVGMYIGNNEVIDAPRTGVQVRIKPLSYWTPQIIAMRRVG